MATRFTWDDDPCPAMIRDEYCEILSQPDPDLLDKDKAIELNDVIVLEEDHCPLHVRVLLGDGRCVWIAR